MAHLPSSMLVSKLHNFDAIILSFPYCKPNEQSSRIRETAWLLSVVCAIGVGVMDLLWILRSSTGVKIAIVMTTHIA